MGGSNGSASRAAHESRLYGQFSSVYDAFVGRVFQPRLVALLRALRIPAGADVLEVGVGTGASLAGYPAHCRLTAVDRSQAMLRAARRKVERGGWTHVDIVEGDATALGFPDDSFDYVNAFHVVTVVDDADRLLREAIRVCRPGGTISIVNRFRSRTGWLDRFERGLEPLTRRWGWRTMRREDLLDGHPLDVCASWRGGPVGLFTTLVARNGK